MGANSEFFIQLQEQFLNDCDKYENGDISALDVAVKFKDEMSFLEHLTNQRKNWIDENLESVSNEADNYNNAEITPFIVWSPFRILYPSFLFKIFIIF